MCDISTLRVKMSNSASYSYSSSSSLHNNNKLTFISCCHIILSYHTIILYCHIILSFQTIAYNLLSSEKSAVAGVKFNMLKQKVHVLNLLQASCDKTLTKSAVF